MTKEQQVSSEVSEYNYRSFTSSEARGKTKVFASILHAGDEAPDFDLPTPEGERVRLSEFRGQKHVLLEFGAIT
jgi:peroxiredoxin